MDSKKLMSAYVAFLRALYLIHQQAHWCTRGASFYSDHTLMQRLYESVQDNADEAAERALGIFGQDCLDLQEQASNINKIISRYTNDNHLANSLQAEKDFLKASKKLYNILEKNDELTLGLDDLIMSIASKHEEAVYLLQQTLSNIES